MRRASTCPKARKLLAEGDVFPNQAFRYGPRAYALQFHPEVTQEMMCRWTTVGAERLTHPGAQPADAPMRAGRNMIRRSATGWTASLIPGSVSLFARIPA